LDLISRHHWVFDLDGTLTVAAHDFDAMRRHLGLAAGVPILEQLDALPPEASAPMHREVEAWEDRLAATSRAEPDATALLEHLSRRGDHLAILTRNTERAAALTLRAAGLARFFEPGSVVGRGQCAHKPSPEGVLHHLHRWGVDSSLAVMVGDYVLDLRAGRAAGAATVLVDRGGHGRWHDEADVVVRSLELLLDG